MTHPNPPKLPGTPAKDFRSPLARARGMGAAREGVHHFWVQRLSAVALVPLSLWFVFSVAQLHGADFGAVRHWVHAPSVAVGLVLFLAALFYHSMLGVQVVIEDYVGHDGLRMASLVASRFAHAIAAVASILAVLKVAL